MRSRFKFLVTLFVVVFSVSFIFFSLSEGVCQKKEDKGSFGMKEESPLKSGSDANAVLETQNRFREINKAYNDRVAFIATEQTVKVNNPFMNDPLFRQYFGLPDAPLQQKRQGLGTGFVLSTDGYVCTNHHVISGVDKITVKIGDKSYEAKLVGSDERTDLALLKINSSDKFDPVYLGDSDNVQVGDWAIAIGNPFGLDKTFTVGVISAVGRKDVDMMGGAQSHIQTDASINPGNSGGPLININGEVIGINRMIYSNSGGSQGIGFAIPINTAKMILEQLKENKKIKRGYLGVYVIPLSAEEAMSRGLESTDGAFIGKVENKSPAMKGGLKEGDVLLSINDMPIKKYEDLVTQVEKMEIGKSIKVTVWRNKAKINLFVTIGERP